MPVRNTNELRHSSSSGVLLFRIAKLCFIETLATSRLTVSFAVKNVNMYSAKPTTTNPRVMYVKSDCRSRSGVISGAMKMPRPAPTIIAPIVRALASLARSLELRVIAPASEP